MDIKEFLNRAVCNYCAVDVVVEMLRQEGFTELKEADAPWNVQPRGRHYVIKNDSAIFAFIAGTDTRSPFNIIAAHTDSPGFRLKPNPEIKCEHEVVKLNTEVYGGAIWDSWMDRPLGLCGRVLTAEDSNPLKLSAHIVRLDEPKLVIPRLAIHFNRDVNKGVALSAQKDMLPILGYAKGSIKSMLAKHLGVTPQEVIDYDITLYDLQGAEAIGADRTWINSGRLDDLAMAWCGLQALLNSGENSGEGENTNVLALFDNEETGSATRQGAHSPALRNILRRIAIEASDEEFMALLANSFLISADCAHAAHPNYMEKMDPVNHPYLGGGPVVKINANCKYMTDGKTAATFKQLCRVAEVPVQEFVNHSDSPGGSTLGNILTSTLDIDGVDMGIGLWAMHSVRETASLTDIDYTIRAFKLFYQI